MLGSISLFTTQTTNTIEDSNTKETPTFLDYIYQLNNSATLAEAFQQSLETLNQLDLAQLNRIGLQTYANGKWTIPIIFQHLIDWERIWCFRAVLFARHEGSIPAAHDQEIMAAHSNANNLSIRQLMRELRAVRQASILLFESFDATILQTTCKFFEYEMPLEAIGLMIAAHQKHHLKVLEERYLPLDQ